MILVIDTSTAELLVGISENSGNILKESRHTATPQQRGVHDARLAAETERLLRQTDISASAIERIGLVIGPGSFTGLRIGLSFAKGLSFAVNAGIVAITQHEALAAELEAEVDYIVTSGYRPGLFYIADALRPMEVELATDLSTLTGRILAHDSLMTSDSFAHASFAKITSHALARIAADATITFAGEALDSLEPLYVTDFTPGSR